MKALILTGLLLQGCAVAAIPAFLAADVAVNSATGGEHGRTVSADDGEKCLADDDKAACKRAAVWGAFGAFDFALVGTYPICVAKQEAMAQGKPHVTHAGAWWLAGDDAARKRLGEKHREACGDEPVYVKNAAPRKRG